MAKKYTIYGDKKVFDNIRKRQQKVDFGIREGMELGADEVKNEAKNIITEKNLILTGEMKRRTVRTDVMENYGRFEVRVGNTITDPPYPRFHEYGTVNIPARPWLRPAKNRADKRFKHEINMGIKRALK
jgi:HK97 gp10 family phage protein